jgi:hypothetical protein
MLKLSTGVYADAKAMTNALASPSAVFYSGDGTNATGFWAIWKDELALVCGGTGGKIGVTESTVVSDFAAAVKIQPINITGGLSA